MPWNYRILAHEHNGQVFLKIHEVYYDKENNPNGYSDASIGGENLEEIKWNLDRVSESLQKPILFAGDKFPQEYKP